jgi:hypothetical protein
MSDENNEKVSKKVWIVVIVFIVFIGFIAYKKMIGH